MGMSVELAIRLAQHDTPACPVHMTMRKANEIFKSNSTGWNTPFAPVDVAFATFVDHLQSNCSQRERDLVYVSEKLPRVWKILHLTMQAMGEQPSDYDKEEIKALMVALGSLGLLALITEDLQPDLVQWVTGLVNAAESTGT